MRKGGIKIEVNSQKNREPSDDIAFLCHKTNEGVLVKRFNEKKDFSKKI